MVLSILFHHHTRHGVWEIIRSPDLHWKACWKSSLFCKVIRTLTCAGGCGSLFSWPTKSPTVLASHQPLAYPMKNSLKIRKYIPIYLLFPLNTDLPWQNWPKAKIDIFIPTFWSPILNILDLQQSGMIKIIRTVQALF